jgi:hypothetical protein
LLLASPLVARGDTSANDNKAAAPTIVSFHTSIGSPPPEDYVIDVHADGRIDVTVSSRANTRARRGTSAPIA